MNQNEEIREMVSTAYGNAINGSTTECGCSAQKAKVTIAGMAGYEAVDIILDHKDPTRIFLK